MDKKLPNDKILEMIRAMQQGQAEDPSLPPHIREMIRKAQEGGAQVLAMSPDQLKALGADVSSLIEDGLSLEVSSIRDTTDPRYAFGNKFAKELADREMELMRITQGHPARGADAIRLLALMFGNIDDIMRVAREKADRSGDIDSERPVMATLAILKTLGFTNVYDALSAGPDRLRWHGVQARALNFIDQFGENIGIAVSKRLDLPLGAVKVIVDEMREITPLSPLPPEKVFDPDLNGTFLRSLLPEMNEGLDALIAAGLPSLKDVFGKTQGLTSLEKDFGISADNVMKFAMILERLDGVSTEAMDAVLDMVRDEDFEEERKRQAEAQPVITLDHPVVLAGLGQNLVTTLEIAGVVDLHEVTGLRPTEAGEAIRKELGTQAKRDIKNVARFLNQDCDCDSCRQFKEAYVEGNPAIKLALRTPAHKPTLH